MIRCFALGLVLTATTAGAVQTQQVDRPGSVAVRIEVNYGLLDQCGAREIPHIIEHTILSETKFGKTPADLIASLNGLGVRLSAVTRQDFTEYVFEGDVGTGAVIHDAVMQTVGRATIPRGSIGREIEAIRLELGEGPDFISKSHPFEVWAYEHVLGAPPPCREESVAVEKLSHAKVVDAFSDHYHASNFSLNVAAPAGEFDANALRDALRAARPAKAPQAREGSKSVAPLPMSTVVGSSSAPVVPLEVLVAIPGRMDLPPARAKAIAEQVRLDVQAALRDDPLSYIARTVVHQSNTAGWVSVTADIAPGRQAELVTKLHELVTRSFNKAATAPLRMALLSNRELVENIHLDAFKIMPPGLQLGDGSVEIRYFKPSDSSGVMSKLSPTIVGLMTFCLFAGIFQLRGTREFLSRRYK